MSLANQLDTYVQSIEFDISNQEINGDGVKDFLWPVSYKERDLFVEKLISSYTDLIYNNSKNKETIAFKFVAKHFISEVVAVFSADLLKHRFMEQSLSPTGYEQWRLWGSLFHNKLPKDPKFLIDLKYGPNFQQKKNKVSFFKKVKHLISLVQLNKQGVGIGNLKIKKITQAVLKNDIIATQRTDAIQAHVGQVKKDVVFCRSGRWFSNVEDAELKTYLSNVSSSFCNDIILLLEKIYNDFGLSLQGASLSYIKHILETSVALVKIHYKRLLDKPYQLPVNVWTGTGGYIWDSMLRYASLELYDGEITGHDHGAGLAHVNDRIMAFAELWGCKNFICLNDNQAIEMTKTGKNWSYFENRKPQLQGWKTASKVIKFEKCKSSSFSVKKVILPVSMTGGDRVWIGPCSSDAVLVDFYAKITNRLNLWGYEVILKSHPELPSPPDLLVDMASEVRYEPLEKMIEEGDLVILDHLYTSIFRSVLSTNIPMVLIDFYNYPWTKNGLELFQKRASFVSGNFDQNNRCNIDWNLLKKAIEEAPSKSSNDDFFEYYYG